MKIVKVFFLLTAIATVSSSLQGQHKGEVKIWEAPLTLPTYMMGPDEVNPMFFKHDSYQGASRVIYPYPLQDNFTNNVQEKDWKALYLENEFIKLCVLPEMGGRLFYATDKTNGYEIFYRQHVIKPAHIGMLGAWISGGIEWCVFHHHRASTALPMDYDLVENADGSKTIWIGETEPRHRMKWALGITLHPGSSLIDVDVRMINRTENINSILYWANVATHVNDDYQVIFPPSVDYAVFHSKVSFSHWPITHEPYLGYEYYKNGIDASWWKNHPNQISFFAHNLPEGFLAGYDHGKDAGTLHVANHHIVAGAKLWEWGPGPRGSFWDTKVLTDNDGPYAELMTGAFSDNQPDYSWIKPYEVKQFKQHWYPIRDIKGVKKANTDACVNLELNDDGEIWLGFNASRNFERATVQLQAENVVLYDEQINIGPAYPFTTTLEAPEGIAADELEARLIDADGNVIIAYRPVIKEYKSALPPEVKPPPRPADIETVEELYLTALRIKQFHNARLDAMEYFNEALKRDPNDIRTNIQVGLNHQSKGMYESAADHYRTAIRRLTASYTRPRDCEALYHLGTVLKQQGELRDAYDTLYRATWDQAFHSAAYAMLAEISCIWKDYPMALQQIDKALSTNAVSTRLLNTKCSILRTLGRLEEAEEIIKTVQSTDPLDHRSRLELVLIRESQKKERNEALQGFYRVMRDEPESYLELTTEYMSGGFVGEARKVIDMAMVSDNPELWQYPTIHYYSGYLYALEGEEDRARAAFMKAESLPTDYCFPFRLESLDVYKRAIEMLDLPAKAHYYMGNVLYDRQPGLAMDHWQQATELDEDMSIAYRNLGWGYNQHKRNISKAIDAYESAIEYDPTHAMYYYELDQLYEMANTEPAKRLELLESNHQYVAKRENSLAREIRVLLLNEMYDKAIDYLENSDFHAQEGTRDLHDTYVEARLLRGSERLREGDVDGALSDFLAADEYPENHQIGRDPNYEMNSRIYYYIGLGYQKAGKKRQAKTYFTKAVEEENHHATDNFYKAMAWKALGDEEKMKEHLNEVKGLSESLLTKEEAVDVFSKFGGITAPHQRTASGHFAKGLYALGNGSRNEASDEFKKALEIDVNQLWAMEYMKELIL